MPSQLNRHLGRIQTVSIVAGPVFQSVGPTPIVQPTVRPCHKRAMQYEQPGSLAFTHGQAPGSTSAEIVAAYTCSALPIFRAEVVGPCRHGEHQDRAPWPLFGATQRQGL